MNFRAIPSEIITFLLVVAVAGAGFLIYAKNKFNSAGPLANAAYFSIDMGDNMAGIASSLQQEGIIASKLVFQIGTYLEKKQNQLNFGLFEIPAQASMAEVLAIITQATPGLFKYSIKLIVSGKGNLIRVRERVPLEGTFLEIHSSTYEGALESDVQSILDNGEPLQASVTIVEGLTSWEIVNSLREAPFFHGNIDFIPEEGSLAPNTYLIDLPADRTSLLNRMQANQSRILEEEWLNRPKNTLFESPDEVLILASIIEKETGLIEEKNLVSSVFTNRLKKRMLLQTDPTLIYGLTEGKEKLGRGLRQSELEKDTPYNTYLHPGLPPTPISNPSRLSIHAALHPAESNYLYFVADGKGGHAFADNYADHRKNVRAWRELNK